MPKRSHASPSTPRILPIAPKSTFPLSYYPLLQPRLQQQHPLPNNASTAKAQINQRLKQRLHMKEAQRMARSMRVSPIQTQFHLQQQNYQPMYAATANSANSVSSSEDNSPILQSPVYAYVPVPVMHGYAYPTAQQQQQLNSQNTQNNNNVQLQQGYAYYPQRPSPTLHTLAAAMKEGKHDEYLNQMMSPVWVASPVSISQFLYSPGSDVSDRRLSNVFDEAATLMKE